MKTGPQMFTMAKWLIMASGSWRLEVQEKLRIPYAIYQFYIRLLYCISIVGIYGNVLENIGVNNDRAIQSLALATNNICMTIKMLISMKKSVIDLIRVAMEDGSKLQNSDSKIQKIISGYDRYARILNIFVMVFTYLVVIDIIICGGSLEYYKYQAAYPNATEKPEHLLFFWTPLDNQKYFRFLLAFQAFVIIHSCAANYSCWTLYNTMMIYAIIKLKILKHHFRSYDNFLTEKEEPNPVLREAKVLRNLKELIKQHQELIRFVHNLNESLKYALLIEYTVSSLMLASILLQVVSGNQIEIYLPYGILIAFQLFILSWNADEIRTQSGNIGKALYESNWYVQSPQVKRLVYIVVMRSRKALSLNIGPFGPNNVNVAMARIKLAYSYVTVMSGNSL